MRNLFLISLILFFGTCKESSQSFYPNFSKQSSFFNAKFYYGEWSNDNDKHVTKNLLNSNSSWGYHFTKAGGFFCFSSHSPWFFEREKGPKFSICFPKEEGEKIYSFLSEYSNFNNIFEVLKIEHEDVEIKIYFLNQNEIAKEIEISNAFLLGEKNLCEEASKTHLPFEDRRYCTSGKFKNLETSFSLPYFSLLEQKEKFLLLFPPPHFLFGNKRIYLTLEFERKSHIEKIFADFFLEIYQKQSIFKAKCNFGEVELSEGMGISSSHTGKFLELHSKSSEVLCFHEFQIKIDSQTIPLTHSTGYLLPESYLLLIPENSRLEGEPYPQIDWKRVQKGKSLKLFQNGFEETWEPEFLGAVYEKEEFSFSKNFHTCQNKNTIVSEKNFCGTPGSPNEWIEPLETCNLEGFELSEWNPKGIFVNNNLESSGKFIELVWNSNPNCKGDFFLLKFGSTEIPFNLSSIDWNKNRFLLFGSERFFRHPNLISRNLGNFSVNSTIVIYDRNGNSKILFEAKSNEFFIPQTTKGVYSLVNQNSKITFHSHSTLYLNNPNYMSPGEVNSYFPSLSEEERNQFYISEYNSRGSYTSSESISEDKFIELFTPYPTHLELVLNYSKGEFYYHIPSFYEYTVLAKENLHCSNYEYTIIENDLLFPFEDVTWNLKINGLVVSSQFFTKAGASFESRKDRIRKSSVYTFPNFKWEFSNSSHPSLKSECHGYTFASPGYPNSFDPLLIQDSENSWKIYFPKDSYLPRNLNIQSIFPNISFSVPVYPRYPFTNFSFPEISSGNLFYLSLEESANYSTFLKEKFVIQAILPNPENPQNEWVLLCNKTEKSYFIEEIIIQDQTHSDSLLPWNARFPRLPTNNPNFSGQERELKPKQCVYVLDPDANQPYLFENGELPTLIWTVRDSSLGNGIGNSEGVDVFQVVGNEKIHLHSFRNFLFGKAWQHPAGKGEIFYLKPNYSGENFEDYEIRKEVLP